MNSITTFDGPAKATLARHSRGHRISAGWNIKDQDGGMRSYSAIFNADFDETVARDQAYAIFNEANRMMGLAANSPFELNRMLIGRILQNVEGITLFENLKILEKLRM